MKTIPYYFVSHSKEFINDRLRVYNQFFNLENHFLHAFLIALGVALLFAVIYYLLIGFRLKKLATLAVWFVMLALSAVTSFTATGISSGLKSKSKHSLNMILEDKFKKQAVKEDCTKQECTIYPQYKQMHDKFRKGMFHVKPVLNLALTNMLLSVLFFWIFSVVFRLVLPERNVCKCLPRRLFTSSSRKK